MIILKTKRLTLRHFTLSDDEAINCVFGDPLVMQYGDGVQPPERVQEWLHSCIDSYNKRGFGPWAVIENSTQKLIGYCGLFYFPDVNGEAETEVGYRLAHASWGKGYATEAAFGVCKYAFESLKINKLIAMIDPENVGSIRVAQKLGMAFEQEVMFEGYTHPDHVYSMTRNDGGS